MDLFDFNKNEETAKPLAERMRANSLDEFIGQKHIVAEGSLLRRAIATGLRKNDARQYNCASHQRRVYQTQRRQRRGGGR